MNLVSRTAHSLIVASLALGGSAAADQIGYQDLVLRLGAATPNGAGVNLCQVEAGGTTYAPDSSAPEFAGKTFQLMSGASGASSHATVVGRNWYGSVDGMADGASLIYCYEAGNFASGAYLRVGQGAGATPLTPPGSSRVFNHSWIGSFGSNGTDNEALRRSDYAMRRDHTLMVCGVNNGAGSAAQPLLSMCYNGLSVGLTTGGHSAGPTPAGIDGAGRQKPEIVAPSDFTSFSTPLVSAAATLLYQTANLPPLDGDIWARRGLVIKSVILSGATHRSTWANNAPTTGIDRGVATLPLDPVLGVDTLNINRSHLALTAGRTELANELLDAEFAGNYGWAQNTWPLGSANLSVFVRFNLATTNNTFAAIANWNRSVLTSQFSSGAAAPKVANLDMTLYRVVANTLVPLTGPGGAPYFASGNCASRSTANNVEHVFLRGLKHGEYALEVRRMDSENVTAETAISWFIDPGPLFGDLNGDGVVGGADLGSILVGWGLPGATDLTGDGTTSGADIGLLLTLWTE